MSSRSLAAARSRRSGENAPTISGNRPGTSIGSAAAFASRGQPPPPPRAGRGQQQQQYQPVGQEPEPANKPFSKLTIAQAIGLITLRLGQVEQWIIDTDANDEPTVSGNQPSIDIGVITSIVNRIGALEKNNGGSMDNEELVALTEMVSKLTQQLTKFSDESIRQSLAIAKHSEQLLRIERDTVETKDIMKTFMLRYDMFVQESSEKFMDFESALTEVEKGLLITNEEVEEIAVIEEIEEENESVDPKSIEVPETNELIESADLKAIVKLELANSRD